MYGVDSTTLVPLLSASAYYDSFRGGRDTAAAEQRYRRLFGLVQLNSQFYFSYTLPVWQTLQATWAGAGGGEGGLDSQGGAAAGSSSSSSGGRAGGGAGSSSSRSGGGGAGAGADAFASDRVWNEWLSRPLRRALGHAGWVLPLAYGCFEQRQLALLGRTLMLTLIARRSREVRESGAGCVVAEGLCVNEGRGCCWCCCPRHVGAAALLPGEAADACTPCGVLMRRTWHGAGVGAHVPPSSCWVLTWRA